MKVIVPAISDETRAILQKNLDKHFTRHHGEDLDAIVAEVLNDQQLFTYLSAFLPNEHGIYLGKGDYWDDIRVNELYGLTLENKGIQTPRGITLFYAAFIGGSPDSLDRLSGGRAIRLSDKSQLPSPQEFCHQVNDALQNADKRVAPLTYEGLRRFI